MRTETAFSDSHDLPAAVVALPDAVKQLLNVCARATCVLIHLGSTRWMTPDRAEEIIRALNERIYLSELAQAAHCHQLHLHPGGARPLEYVLQICCSVQPGRMKYNKPGCLGLPL